jgi:hydrogenase maturation factor
VSRCGIDHDAHCITCGDIGVTMYVQELRGELAVCLDVQGERHEVAVDLIGPLQAGDEILVHAGVAIA